MVHWRLLCHVTYGGGSLPCEARASIHVDVEQLELQKFDFSLTMYNRMIKIICKEAGVSAESSIYKAGKKQTGPKWQFVSSHTARRSFATNLYLAGCDLYTISRMMGHTSVDMTERYICCGLRELDSRVMRYFE